MKVSHAYESGTKSKASEEDSPFEGLSPRSGPSTGGRPARALTRSTLAADRLRPPYVHYEADARRRRNVWLLILGLGIGAFWAGGALVTEVGPDIRYFPVAEFISGALSFGGFLAVLFGVILSIHWQIHTRRGAELDEKGRKDLEMWDSSWLCDTCGSTFQPGAKGLADSDPLIS